jgi:hypothetical protein
MKKMTGPMHIAIFFFVSWLPMSLVGALSPIAAWGQPDATGDIESRGLPGQPLSPASPGQLSPPLPSAMPLKQGLPSFGATCLPVEVTTTKDRVQIKCKIPLQAPAGLQFFAVGADDPAFASRVMKLAATAQIANAQIQIVFNPNDLSGERIGCPANTCRVIQAITLIDN